MLHTQELLAGYLGARLGLYEALDRGPADVAELCARTGLDPRYAREWLEQQAVAGFIEVDDVTAAPERRVYRLPPGHAEVLLASDSPLSLVSLTMLPLGGVAGALPALLEAYRTGAGVPDEVYGDDWRHGHSGANRALFTYSLPGWLSSALPHIHQRLAAAPSRIADIGCGAGWAAIALAEAYPSPRSTATTWTRRRWPRRRRTPLPPAWPTGCGFTGATPWTRSWRAGTTWSASSTRCTR